MDIGGGWVWMGRSASTTQHRPSHTLQSDHLVFFFFLVDVGWVSWVLMGWCWWVMAMGGLIFMGCDGWCWWVRVDFGFWLILDFSYGSVLVCWFWVLVMVVGGGLLWAVVVVVCYGQWWWGLCSIYYRLKFFFFLWYFNVMYILF